MKTETWNVYHKIKPRTHTKASWRYRRQTNRQTNKHTNKKPKQLITNSLRCACQRLMWQMHVEANSRCTVGRSTFIAHLDCRKQQALGWCAPSWGYMALGITPALGDLGAPCCELRSIQVRQRIVHPVVVWEPSSRAGTVMIRAF